MPPQACLGIESTAHTFGVGIVTFDGRILANAKDMFTTEAGGMVPTAVAQHHREVRERVIAEALKQAGITMDAVALIAFSRGPGLAPCLKVGLETAKGLAARHGKPVMGANHCVAHLTIGNLVTGAKDPVYLYVSGANTQVIALAGGRFRIFGETLDVGLGNALDKFGREAGLGFPAGPKIEQVAKQGSYVELPYAVKGMDVSFSGMVTKAARMAKEGKAKVEDLCFSLQETSFAMLAEVAERAMAHTGKDELLLIGGVAANQRLCAMLKAMCGERGARFYPVPLQYSGDQGVMIAWQAVLQHQYGSERLPLEEADMLPYERTDEVDVTWAAAGRQ
jgi:N6-L-threonylcarbamoyladenine synthase